MMDHECQIDSALNDLANFCFDHPCDGETLLYNEMNAIFQVTGALNMLAAIYYEEFPPDDAHLAWFDRHSEIGFNVGKLMRYTMNFDPKTVRDW